MSKTFSDAFDEPFAGFTDAEWSDNGEATTGIDDDEPDILIPVPSWPVLSEVALQGAAGELVRLLDPDTEADPAAVLACLLSAAGAYIGIGPHILVANEKHPALIWPLIIGGTNEGAKGTAWSLVRKILDRVDFTFAADCVASGLSSGEGLIERVRDGHGDDPSANDFDEGVLDKRLLVVETEFAAVLARLARSGNTLGPIMRDTWDGRPLQTMNREKSKLRADTHHIAVIANITPGELVAKLEQSDLDGGTVNRFLPVMSKRSKDLPEGGNISDEVLNKAVAILRAAQDAARSRPYERTSGARELWRRRYAKLAAGLGGERRETQATARARPQVLRLALAYALIDCSDELRVEHLRAALAFWDYVLASAVYVFGNPHAPGDDDASEALLAFIAACGSAGRTREQIRSDHFGRHKLAKDITALLAPLIKAGRVDQTVEPTTGRPRTVFRAREKGGRRGMPSDLGEQ